jgi:tRNA G18 (ribose-2'-O)-methylase SpoU
VLLVFLLLDPLCVDRYSLVGLEQTAESTQLPNFTFPSKTVLVLGREKEGVPPEIIDLLDATVEIPQLGVIRSLNVHVSGAIAMYEYTKQQLQAQQSAG